MKLDILAFAAHPDDVEIACSGTVAKYIAEGKKVGIVDLTAGELGSRGSAELRKIEAEKSTKILGISYRANLGLADGFFEHNQESILKIIEQIRHTQPEIIFAPTISDRHPDHGRAAKLVADASFYSGLRKIESKFNNTIQSAYRPKALYHYIQDYFLDPDFVIDITPYFDKKMESILAFDSQFYNPKSTEPVTPISTPEFLEGIKARSLQMGRLIHVKYGEGFKAARTPGVKNIFDLF